MQAVHIDEAPTHLPDGKVSFLHYHEHYEIGICIGGEGIFITPASAEAVQEGDMIFFPPRARHYSRSITTCVCRFIYIHADAVTEKLTTSVPCVIRKKEHPQASMLLRQLTEDADKPLAERRILLRMNLFLLEANDWFTSDISHARAGLAEQIAEYLSSRYNQPLTMHELASHFNFSESQLRRRFSAVYGCPPMEYRNRLRCQIGLELLQHTDRTVAEIAEHLGFSAPSDFYRLFTQHYGMSPTKKRRTLRNTM